MESKCSGIIDKIDNFCAIVKVDSIERIHIGITKDPIRRLFHEHKISDEDYWWIYIKADSEETARAVERYFIEMGMQGGTGGGDNESVFVYCFVEKQG